MLLERKDSAIKKLGQYDDKRGKGSNESTQSSSQWGMKPVLYHLTLGK